jgi:ATP-binding cassette subfamily B multidrug efflux pump
MGIGGVLRALNSNPSMAWIIAVAVAAVLVAVIVIFNVTLPKFRVVQKLVDRLNQVVNEALSGMLVIRAFNRQKSEEEKYDDLNKKLASTNLFINRLMILLMPVMMLVMNSVTLVIVWVGSHQVDLGTMQVGNMMAFMQYTIQIIMSFLMLSIVSIMLPRASVAAQRIAEVLYTDPVICDPASPSTFNPSKRGLLEYKNVSFRYKGAQDYALKGITFTAMPGEITAIIGGTGSGKSTLVNLILRFYEKTGGELLLSGVDVSKVALHELREKIGYVPQKGTLFSGTIESNLKYANENATEEELVEATKTAQIYDFIEQSPDKFKTSVSQGGTNVSGGQKQRLSIARALVKKPEIYIFDDCFSALDYKTEAMLKKSLKEQIRREGATALVVSQRVATVMYADKIIVLDEGRIAGEGIHCELMEKCEVYREIVLSQLSREELSL